MGRSDCPFPFGPPRDSAGWSHAAGIALSAVAFLAAMLALAVATPGAAGLQVKAAHAASPEGPSSQAANWPLVLDEEFNGTTLDTSKWTPGFPWCVSGVTCSSDATPEVAYVPDNVLVSNGTLKLRATRGGTSGRPYASGMISTASLLGTGANKFQFRYGFVEVRAKFPKGQGLFPAVWTLPIDGGRLPEIDVTEAIGSEPNQVVLYYHYDDGSGKGARSGGAYYGPDFTSEFHTYGVSWEPGAIRWYVDGVERREAFTDKAYLPTQSMYLLLNLQVGGNWAGSPDDTTPFPADMEVDYVRVWSPQGELAAPAPTATPAQTGAPTPTVIPSPTTTPTPLQEPTIVLGSPATPTATATRNPSPTPTPNGEPLPSLAVTPTPTTAARAAAPGGVPQRFPAPTSGAPPPAVAPTPTPAPASGGTSSRPLLVLVLAVSSTIAGVAATVLTLRATR